jgi:hypothetical protein
MRVTFIAALGLLTSVSFASAGDKDDPCQVRLEQRKSGQRNHYNIECSGTQNGKPVTWSCRRYTAIYSEPWTECVPHPDKTRFQQCILLPSKSGSRNSQEGTCGTPKNCNPPSEDLVRMDDLPNAGTIPCFSGSP